MLFNRLIRSESGNALISAIGVLSVTGVVTATVFSVSTQLSSTSNKSRDTKKALAAADAGLEAAVYRLNKQNVQSTTQCFTTQLVAATGGECPGQTESLGNGSGYTYYVTPALGASDQCAGLPVSHASSSIGVTQRCVTVAGTSNGVARRVQARVASYIGLSLISMGLLGLEGVELKNSSSVNAWVGSNGQIEMGNSNTVTGVELGPSAPNVSIGDSGSVGSVVRRSASQGNHVLAPVDVGNSATVNDNVRLTNGQDAKSGVTFNSTTRELEMGNSSSLTLGGGTYNWCDFEATNSAQLTVAAGVKTRIFIDSPERPGSGCASGTGRFVAKNSINISNSGPAENLQIYVYGRSGSDEDDPDVEFKNSVNFSKGFIYAPQSHVEFKNSADITGAVNSKTIAFKNSVTFTWETSLADLRATTLSMFYKTAWKECRAAQTSAADPESGCTS